MRVHLTIAGLYCQSQAMRVSLFSQRSIDNIERENRNVHRVVSTQPLRGNKACGRTDSGNTTDTRYIVNRLENGVSGGVTYVPWDLSQPEKRNIKQKLSLLKGMLDHSDPLLQFLLKYELQLLFRTSTECAYLAGNLLEMVGKSW